jgi:hypothetical protein
MSQLREEARAGVQSRPQPLVPRLFELWIPETVSPEERRAEQVTSTRLIRDKRAAPRHEGAKDQGPKRRTAPAPQTCGQAPNVSKRMGAEMDSAGDKKASPDGE